MIRIFYGPPGAGKSFGTLRDLVEELLWGIRLIVTNLSVSIGELNAYLQAEYPGVDFGDINGRIRIISEEETRRFYCYRSLGGPPLYCPSREESLAGKHVPYPPRDALGPIGMDGVVYYIDEAHIAFDAREWQVTGPELTYYTSQHRKLNDECVFITQHPDMLERRLRMLAQQFWSHNNNALEKFLTFFQKPSFFTQKVYRRPPTGGPGDAPAEETHRYTLKLALANCYDTSAGIGIAGRKLPEKKRKKGWPVWLLIIPVVIVALVMMKIPGWSSRLMVKGIKGETEKIQKETVSTYVKPSGPSSQVVGQPVPAAIGAPTPPEPVYVRYWAIKGKDAIVVLSDGRELTRGSGLARITIDFVEDRQGNRYPIRRGLSIDRSSARPAAKPPAR